MAKAAIITDDKPPLSTSQVEMLDMLKLISGAIERGEVGQIAVITVGQRGINVGFNDVDYGGVMIGAEQMKAMILAKINQPVGRSTILRPGKVR